MKSAHLIFSVFLSIFIFTSCNQDPCLTKDQFLDSYDTFIKELQDNQKELSATEKESFEIRFEELVNNCYKKFKPDLTLEEKQDFWKSSIKYYLAKEGEDINIKISKSKNEFEDYVQAEIEEVIKESGSKFLGALEKIMEENLPKLFEGFSNELGKFAEDLEKIFEEKK